MDSEAGWSIRLCGPLSVMHDGRALEGALPGRQGRLLFAYLLDRRATGASRSDLVDLLWPEGPPAAVESALSALLSKLRKALGDGMAAGRGDPQLTLQEPVRVDVEAAEAAASRAASARVAGDWAAAAGHAAATLGADGRSFLPGLEGPWVQQRRRELEAVRVEALECLAEAGLRSGALPVAERAARTLVAAAPFRESGHRLLMEVHEAGGNHAEAVRAFDDLRRLLRDELGTTPGPRAMAVHTRLVRGERAPDPSEPALTPITWPPALAASADRGALVGRDAPLGDLRAAWRAAASGRRQLALITGDAGIGKTRLAAELAREAHAEGAVVIYGRFDEEAIAPHATLVEMLRGWSGGASLEPLRDRLGQRARALAPVLPELGMAPAGDRQPSDLRGAESAALRHRFFDAVAGLLAEISAGAPLVIVLDDLQWGHGPAVALLRHVLRAPQPRRLLVLGTYRDAETAETAPVLALAAEAHREGTLCPVALAGLDPAAVEALAAALDPALPADAARTLHRETDGNPLFVEELVRYGLDGAELPAGVRAVTQRRLARLGPDARRVLDLAAVAGRGVDFDVLGAAAELEEEALVGALDELLRARILQEAGRVGRYGFRHAVVRQALLDALGALRAARLHGRVGEAILALRSPALDPHLAALAHHFSLSAPVERPERALEFELRAARRATALLAPHEAAVHWRGALRARELMGAEDDADGVELLLACAACEERAGDPAARASWSAAAAAARRVGDPALLARAALGYAGPWGGAEPARPDVVDRLEEAIAALGPAESPLRARALSRLALELCDSGTPERRRALSEEAVALAYRLDDPPTLAACLDARHYALQPEPVG